MRRKLIFAVFSVLVVLALAVSPVYAPEQLLTSPQLEERGFFRRATLESGRDFQMPGLPFPTDFVSPAVRPAPAPGEHNRLVYGELLRHTPEELAQWQDVGAI